MNRGAWQSTVHGVTKSQTQLTTQLWYVCVFLWVCMYELYGIYNFLILSQLNMLDVLAPYWIVNIVRMVNLSLTSLILMPACFHLSGFFTFTVMYLPPYPHALPNKSSTLSARDLPTIENTMES